MKRILMSLVLLTTLTGCGNDTSNEVDSASETTDATKVDSSSYEENMTGGTEVSALAETR